jgi:hypothetical protein
VETNLCPLDFDEACISFCSTLLSRKKYFWKYGIGVVGGDGVVGTATCYGLDGAGIEVCMLFKVLLHCFLRDLFYMK